MFVRARLKWLAAAAAALLALAAVLPAWAGGVVVGLVGEAPVPQAGEPFTVHFTIHSMHDGSPQDGFEPAVSVFNPATGETVTAQAEPLDKPGMYAATITLPAAGEWQWQIMPWPEYPADFALQPPPLQVQAASAAPAATAGGQAPGWGLALVAAVAAVGISAAAWLTRRRSAPARA
jgi:hypothetical protein